MSDIIRILGIARRALHAQQTIMNTAGNNIANVNTEGYSRQRVTLAEGRSLFTAQGFLGSGVTVQTIERIRSTLIDQQLQSERPSLEQNMFKSGALEFVEDIFSEPSDFGISSSLEDFFNAWQDLGNDPESAAGRTVVRQRAITLANNFNRVHRQLSNYQSQLNLELKETVDEVNRLTAEIAKINQSIVNAEVNGHQSPALRDQRDKIVDDLSKLVDVRTSENEFGAITVSIANRTLVVDTQSENISLQTQSASDPGPVVVMERDKSVLNIANGKIKGILDIRDVNVPKYKTQLDQLAVNFTTALNNVHTTGYNLNGITSINFFDPGTSGASDFAVSSEILGDANLIATSDTINEPGNNRTSLAIVDLQDSLLMDNGQFTFSDYYSSLITTIGSETQEANLLEESFGLTVEKLEFTRDSISSGSLHEEMTLIIEAQQAYTAAARVVTNVDEMVQTVLNMV